jgi:hypothetical protein
MPAGLHKGTGDSQEEELEANREKGKERRRRRRRRRRRGRRGRRRGEDPQTAGRTRRRLGAEEVTGSR